MAIQKNTGRLCSVYCPSCGKVTDKISWNLLREAKRVNVNCPVCGEITRLEYIEGKGASVSHTDSDTLNIVRKMLDAKDDEDADLTLEKIRELHDGVEKRIDELTEKAKKRLDVSKRLAEKK